MHQTWHFALPTKILFGKDSLNGMVDAIATVRSGRSQSRGLLVIDPALHGLGLHAKLQDLCGRANVALAVFSNIEPNPRLTSIEAAHELYVAEGCSFVIGFGGGSALDAAKAVSILATNPGPLPAYTGVDKYAVPPCPIYAVPTTAGTGSEVSWSAVFFDDRENRKCSVRGVLHAPRLAALDPDLLRSLPKSIVASGGIDALSHAVESLVSKLASPMSAMFSLDSITRVARHLRPFYENPADTGAASGMLLASLNAGIAFLHARVGIAHALSHPLEKLYGMPHGQACACVLPEVMRYARPGNVPMYARVAEIFAAAGAGEQLPAGMDDETLSKAAPDMVERFINGFGLATNLSAWSKGPLSEEEVTILVEGAIRTQNHLNSPVVPDEQSLRDIIAALSRAA